VEHLSDFQRVKLKKMGKMEKEKEFMEKVSVRLTKYFDNAKIESISASLDPQIINVEVDFTEMETFSNVATFFYVSYVDFDAKKIKGFVFRRDFV
jgi:hypothetical protein